MIKHTDNPAERAASIAEHEAKPVWEETRDWNCWYQAWLAVYRQVLAEFVQLTES